MEFYLIRTIKILSDTLSYFISVYISFLFYTVPLSIALKEVNYSLIIGGYLLFIFSVLNYKGYDQAIDFSLIREITSLINAALLTLIVSILVLFIFQIEI